MRAEEIIRKRANRAIAVILNVKERDVDPLLPDGPEGRHASDVMRKVVLDQINDLTELVVDVALSGDTGGFEFNAEVWAPRIQGKLDEIHRAVLAQTA